MSFGGGEISLRHLPDLSDESVSLSLSFQIPLGGGGGPSGARNDNLLADASTDFFAAGEMSMDELPPQSKAQEMLTLSQLTPARSKVKGVIRRVDEEDEEEGKLEMPLKLNASKIKPPQLKLQTSQTMFSNDTIISSTPEEDQQTKMPRGILQRSLEKKEHTNHVALTREERREKYGLRRRHKVVADGGITKARSSPKPSSAIQDALPASSSSSLGRLAVYPSPPKITSQTHRETAEPAFLSAAPVEEPSFTIPDAADMSSTSFLSVGSVGGGVAGRLVQYGQKFMSNFGLFSPDTSLAAVESKAEPKLETRAGRARELDVEVDVKMDSQHEYNAVMNAPSTTEHPKPKSSKSESNAHPTTTMATAPSTKTKFKAEEKLKTEKSKAVNSKARAESNIRLKTELAKPEPVTKTDSKSKREMKAKPASKEKPAVRVQTTSEKPLTNEKRLSFFPPTSRMDIDISETKAEGAGYYPGVEKEELQDDEHESPVSTPAYMDGYTTTAVAPRPDAEEQMEVVLLDEHGQQHAHPQQQERYDDMQIELDGEDDRTGPLRLSQLSPRKPIASPRKAQAFSPPRQLYPSPRKATASPRTRNGHGMKANVYLANTTYPDVGVSADSNADSGGVVLASATSSEITSSSSPEPRPPSPLRPSRKRASSAMTSESEPRSDATAGVESESAMKSEEGTEEAERSGKRSRSSTEGELDHGKDRRAQTKNAAPSVRNARPTRAVSSTTATKTSGAVSKPPAKTRPHLGPGPSAVHTGPRARRATAPTAKPPIPSRAANPAPAPAATRPDSRVGSKPSTSSLKTKPSAVSLKAQPSTSSLRAKPSSSSLRTTATANATVTARRAMSHTVSTAAHSQHTRSNSGSSSSTHPYSAHTRSNSQASMATTVSRESRRRKATAPSGRSGAPSGPLVPPVYKPETGWNDDVKVDFSGHDREHPPAASTTGMGRTVIGKPVAFDALLRSDAGGGGAVRGWNDDVKVEEEHVRSKSRAAVNHVKARSVSGPSHVRSGSGGHDAGHEGQDADMDVDGEHQERRQEREQGYEPQESEGMFVFGASGSSESTRTRVARGQKEKENVHGNSHARSASRSTTLKSSSSSTLKLSSNHHNITIPLPPPQSTTLRLLERQKFDQRRKANEALEAKRKEEEEERRREEEERELKEMRKRMVVKAHEVPEWYRNVPRKERENGENA